MPRSRKESAWVLFFFLIAFIIPASNSPLHIIFLYEYAVLISHRALHMLNLVLEEELSIQFRKKISVRRNVTVLLVLIHPPNI